MTCPICILPYNKLKHKIIICPNMGCNYETCKECVKKYLLSTNKEPHCMNCKKKWSEEFIINNTSRNFHDKELKEHRKKYLLDIEISKLPDTMQFVENVKKKKENDAKMKVCIDRILELQKLISVERKKISALSSENRTINSKKANIDKQGFIMPCPMEDCRGFLSSGYKCGICDCYTCPKCIKPIGNYKNKQEHICNENDIKTAEIIKTTTKPCPSCGERIGKVSGCDQMWCVKCHTAFSWRTGEIETGNIHNPHFYQWQRENNGNTRNPQDIICGGLMNWYRIRNYFARFSIQSNIKDNNVLFIKNNFKIIIEKFHNLHISLSHYEQYIIPTIRTHIRTITDHKELRIKYLLNEITQDDMAKTIYRKDQIRKKNIEILHVYELMLTVGIDLFNNILDYISDHNVKFQNVNFQNMLKFIENSNNFFINEINKYDKLRIYCNKELYRISLTYKTKVTILTENFTSKNEKIKSNVEYKKKAIVYN